MPRLHLTAAALAAVILATPGCSRNRDIPSQLAPSRTTSIGVNSYLWRAAIDTVSFAPLLQADSAGGVIVTDWYSNPTSPTERVKLTVSILDQDLRADALRVAASRQVNRGGSWIDAPVSAATVQKLEDIILTRARDLRRTAVSG
jgi:alpha-beta hydrolase superfamily lysophospholipase